MPCSTIWPLSMTKMTSASRIVDRRWAITKLVRCDRRAAIAFWISTSVRVSTELVASSRIRIVGSARNAAGDREQLLLAGADVAALVVDDRVVAVGQRVDETVDVRRPCRLEDLLVGGVEVAEGDVLPDGAAEQPRVLQHHADVRAQLAARASGRCRCRRVVIAPAVEFVEAHDQVDERGLAGAGRADDGDGLAGLGDERQVGDQRVVRVVGERHVVELDPPAGPLVVQRRRVVG